MASSVCIFRLKIRAVSISLMKMCLLSVQLPIVCWMVFSGSNGCLYQMPTFKNLFPRYNKKSISSAPVSMSTTLLLESASWCLSSQKIIQMRCLILRYKCDLTPPCELLPEKSLSRAKRKRHEESSKCCADRWVWRWQRQPSLKYSRHGRRGLPDPLQEVETRPLPLVEGVGPALRIRRESS